MMRKAIGFLEVCGYSVALASMDKACKTVDVTICGIDVNNPSQGENAQIPVVVQVKMMGEISNVEIALEVAKAEASKFICENEILTHLIPQTTPELEKLLFNGKVNVK